MPRAIRTLSALVAAAAVLGTTACDKLPLLAPTESTITLFPTSTVLAITGSIEVIATVLEKGGTPVHNGTVVTFTTTLGSIDPREARTNAGKATARLSANGQSGIARVGAISGGAKATEVEIKVGAAAAEKLELSATPGTLPSTGGAVQLTAVVTDLTGNRLAGVPVNFTTNAGVLSSGQVTTDQNGEARVTLTTTREAVVNATAGGKTGTVTVRINAAPGLNITVAATPPPVAGQPVSFTIQVTAPAGGSAVQNVTVEWGDGQTLNLGTLTGSTTVSHVYASPGTYTVTVRATDSSGERVSVSTQVTVADRTPIGVNVTAAPNPAPPNSPVTLTATVTPATTAVRRYEWDFGDGLTAVTTGNITSHIYSELGRFTVTVRVVAVDGSVGTGRVEVRIN